MDRHLFAVIAASGALLTLPAALHAAPTPAPVPDPRLEQALNVNVISQVERSIQLDRAVAPVDKPRKPAVDRAEMLEVREDVYVDRGLAPQRPPRDGEDAVRVFRRDAITR